MWDSSVHNRLEMVSGNIARKKDIDFPSVILNVNLLGRWHVIAISSSNWKGRNMRQKLDQIELDIKSNYFRSNSETSQILF